MTWTSPLCELRRARMEMSFPKHRMERPMSTIIRFGLDLAKNTFSICGVDAQGKVVLRKMVPRSQLLVFFSQQAPAVVGMEAGSGAHHWPRRLKESGHDARILDPRLVAPYRKQGRSGAVTRLLFGSSVKVSVTPPEV